MKKEYPENGKFTINERNGDLVASIIQPNETVARNVKLSRTRGGHLRGFIQPADAEEELSLKAFRSAEQKQAVDLSALPDGVTALYQDQDGKSRLVYVLDDVVDANGKCYELAPGEVFIYDRLDDAHAHRKKNGGEKSDDEPAAFSGWAITIDGKLTRPAAWIQFAQRGKDGKPLEKPRVFFSGWNRTYDREAYLAAMGERASKSDELAR